MRIDFSPSNENAFGVALLAGRVVGTITGSTGHITVRAVCKAKIDGHWATVPYEKATHVFLDVPSADGDFADKIGTYYPGGKYAGHFFEDRHADPLRVKAARYLLDTIAGKNAGTHVLKSERCARCSRELTHPDSIFSQFGPECIKYVAPYMTNNSGTDAAPHQTKAPTMKAGNTYGEPPAGAPAIVEKQAAPLPKHPVDMTDAAIQTELDTSTDADRVNRLAAEKQRRAVDAASEFKPPQPSAELAESPIVAILKAGDDAQQVLIDTTKGGFRAR